MLQERKRKHHQRSKAGCLTCKRRHRRCDEAKPFCHNCLKTGGSCGYPDSPSSKILGTNLDLSNEHALFLTVPSLKYDYSSFYGPLPYCLSQQSKMLFNHGACYHVLTRTAVKKKFRHSEIQFSTSDIVILHAALHLTANHWICIGGDPQYVTQALYHHKLEAIRLVRERLQDPTQATDDSTIAAVALLLLAEVLYGNVGIAAQHLDGLEMLMNLRGDIHVDNLNGFLPRIVLLADTLTSSRTNQLPRFYSSAFTRSQVSSPTPPSKLVPPPRSKSPFVRQSVIEFSIFSPDGIQGNHLELTKMFRDLRTHSAMATAYESGTDFADETEVLSRLCAIEKFIDTFVHGRIERINPHERREKCFGTNLGQSSDVPVRPCGVVGSIYIYLFLRKIPVTSPIYDWMVSLVQEEFERFSEEVLERMYPPEIIFWMLFVAGAASFKRDERGWFVRRLVSVRDTLELKEWDGAKKLLGQLAWMDTSGEEHGRKLWNELEAIA